MLILAQNQKEQPVPYTFRATNISVYTFEEVLYHSYTHFKDSADDITTEEFLAWATAIGLGYIAARIRDEIVPLESFTEKLTGFLTLIEYFDDDEIEELREKLTYWENRREWERLKERADLAAGSSPARAYALYKRALLHGENADILNNMGVCLMQMRKFDEAYTCLAKSYQLCDRHSSRAGVIVFSLAEAAIYSRNFDAAQEILDRLQKAKNPQTDKIFYLYGELNLALGDTKTPVKYFEQAFDERPQPLYAYRLADAYLSLRMFDKALRSLDNLSAVFSEIKRDSSFLRKQAEVNAKAQNLPTAIRLIEKAVVFDKNNIELWVDLAMYYRVNYDVVKAQSAVAAALALDDTDERALLENARIKKALGRTRDYQEGIKTVLLSLKKRYREFIKTDEEV
ncbi:hypothetical protein AGMMS49975_10410 [Clostridia bacterium]|nr:hypothetical protein AGMMS49975_10410 [Clostridia bacterium]